MPEKDIHNDLKMAVALAAQVIASDTTTVGEIIDNQEAESLEFVFQTGVLTDGDYALLIEHGDAANLSDAAAVPDTELLGTEAGASFTADTDDKKTGKIGYVGSKRYVRASIVSTNFAATGALVAVLAILGNVRHKPESDQVN